MRQAAKEAGSGPQDVRKSGLKTAARAVITERTTCLGTRLNGGPRAGGRRSRAPRGTRRGGRVAARRHRHARCVARTAASEARGRKRRDGRGLCDSDLSTCHGRYWSLLGLTFHHDENSLVYYQYIARSARGSRPKVNCRLPKRRDQRPSSAPPFCERLVHALRTRLRVVECVRHRARNAVSSFRKSNLGI